MTGGESLAGEAKNEFGAAVGVVNSAGRDTLVPGQRGKGRPKAEGDDQNTSPTTTTTTSATESTTGGGGQNGGSPERPKPGGDIRSENENSK